jgi:hypothetical protein
LDRRVNWITTQALVVDSVALLKGPSGQTAMRAAECGSLVRADHIAEPGIITRQVIKHIFEDALVVGDLSERNPNVFYELALSPCYKKASRSDGAQRVSSPLTLYQIRMFFKSLSTAS